MIRIETVVEQLPSGFEVLRAEALSEGRGFIEKLAVDWRSGAARFNRDGEALLAATVNGELAGIGGITIEPVLPGALRMRRFYVRPSWRRSGVGIALATALLSQPTRRHGTVTVNAAKDSIPFWEALGFRPDARDGHTHIFTAAAL